MAPLNARPSDAAKAEPHSRGALELQALELDNEVSSLRAELERARTMIAAQRIGHMDLQQQLREEEIRRQRQSDASSKELHANLTQAEHAKLDGVGTIGRAIGVRMRLSPEAYFGSQHSRDIGILERLAMRTGSVRAREAIAYGATDLMLSLEELLLIARGFQTGIFNEAVFAALQGWNVRSLLSLARVLGDQSVLPEDEMNALAIYELVLAKFGIEAFNERARYMAIEVALDLGRAARAGELMQIFGLDRVDPVQAALLNANDSFERHGATASWLRDLNAVYRSQGLSEISVNVDGEGDLLDRLEVNAGAVETGPLVTVMMPTFNGGEWIETAIKSVLDQTWRNLELIVVDDHSEEQHWQKIQNLIASDPRAHAYRLDTNQGAYRARNLAFGYATGEFVTVHDDDDWSHPQKIEKQVQHLLDNPDEIANMSYQTRIDQHQRFLRINENHRFNQRNYSSLMTRRKVVERIGAWDDLNRAADAEFHDRLALLFGVPVAAVETAPLSFMRARSGSLTSGEIRRGALDFARQTFGYLYRGWHLRLARDGRLLAQDGENLDPKRRFYAVPANMLPGRRALENERFDVVYITDFRFPGGNSSLMAAEISAAAEAGFRVGVAHIDSPVLRAPHAFNSTVHDVLLEHSIPVLSLTDRVSTDLLVLRNPTILQFCDRLRSGIDPSVAVLIANTAPFNANGSNFAFDLAACLDHAETTFGVTADVFPESPQTSALLQLGAPGVQLAETIWPGFVEPESYRHTRRPSFGRRPVVGRHSRDHSSKWPGTADEIRRIYVNPSKHMTRVLGGADSIAHLIDLNAHESVEVLEFNAMEPVEFLKGIDFWVYFHQSQLTESFGMAALEAMASGAVVILPSYMEELFGEAALYAEPEAVTSLIDEVWSSEALYVAQSEAAARVVQQHFSVRSYIERLSECIERGASRRERKEGSE